MPEISARAMLWARGKFMEEMEQLLDDPSHLLSDYREQEPEEALAGYREIAAGLEMDFYELVQASGSEFERVRLRKIETGEICPSPKVKT